MRSVEAVTDADFAEVVLASGKPVLVDFWKQSCGPCRMLAPVLEDLARSQRGLDIVKIDVEANPDIAAAYGVSSLPALKVFRGGQVVKTIIGAKPRGFLVSELAEFTGEVSQR